MVGRAAICAAALLWAAAAAAQDTAPCRLALVLALDVSSSVDTAEYDLQRKGLAAALDAPDVRHAILNGAPGPVALAVYEWSGADKQKLQLDWTMLRDGAAIDAAVATLGAMARSNAEFPTSLGPALGYGAQLLQRGPRCARRVIDVSGDGVNNYRFGPREAYRHFPLDGVTVNGLVVLGGDASVLAYYGDEVLHGAGAFLVVANGFEEFREAMTRKLYREINDIVLGRAAPARLRAWLRTRARERLADASDRHAARLGMPYRRLTLRDTRSRWGSCSAQGGLMYSWRLVMAPGDVLDYVAAHEVAHLAEMNHSPAFWNTVARLKPGYETPRRWLRENGAALHRYRFGD